MGRAIRGDPAPWHPLGLPWDEMRATPGVPRDHGERRSTPCSRCVATGWHRPHRRRGLTAETLAAATAPVEATGWPAPACLPGADCLRAVLNEEWEHHLYAERDLDRLSPG